MKLIIAIIQDQDESALSNALLDHNIRSTKLKTQGSFLRSGNVTFMIGIEDERVDEALELIKEYSSSRETFVPTPVSMDLGMEVATSFPVKVEVGGATVFVLPVDDFYRF